MVTTSKGGAYTIYSFIETVHYKNTVRLKFTNRYEMVSRVQFEYIISRYTSLW